MIKKLVFIGEVITQKYRSINNMDSDLVTLVSQDGKEFKVAYGAVKVSETVKNLIEDAGVDNPIPLPNITGRILEKIVEYMNHYHTNPRVAPDGAEGAADSPKANTWDLKFFEVDQPTIFDLILASNYLDMKDLLDLACQTVANMIKGKTPEEIRKTFNITNDFTPEEEEAVRKENEWCEEK